MYENSPMELNSPNEIDDPSTVPPDQLMSEYSSAFSTSIFSISPLQIVVSKKLNSGSGTSMTLN